MDGLTAEVLGEKWLSFTNEQRSELLSQRRENQLNENALDTSHQHKDSDMPIRYSTARGRAFGEGMRAAIAASGMTGRELAEVLTWQEAKISDMVNGKGGVTREDVLLVLGACRVPEPERDRLLRLFPATDLDGWWQPHGVRMPIRQLTATTHLHAATSLVSWHPHAIPDLLQTAGHARAWLTASATVPATELDDRVQALLESQKTLRNYVDCTFYIHEFALALQVGGYEVHVAQLCDLMLKANWHRIKILVVPVAAGAHPGIAGPFTLLKFPKFQPMIWTRTENSSLFVEAKPAVEGYDSVVRLLKDVSLNEHDSKALISGMCVRLRKPADPDLSAGEVDDTFPPL